MGASGLQSADSQRLRFAASGCGLSQRSLQTLSHLYTSGCRWRQRKQVMMEARACVACIASVLPSVIEAIDDDYSTPEMLELVLGTY